jgi:hypothetical protein
MADRREDSFTKLAGVDVHYDRDPGHYGTRGRPYVFKCQTKLKNTLEACFSDLFSHLPGGKPALLTSAGTIGDNENEHGQGLAFDLDGIFWDSRSLIMNDFFNQKYLYLGINAHLYLHFSQVLNFYYPKHDDHFHVDFNFSYHYRPSSNAQTYFLQACLKYIYDEDLGRRGQHGDGVDGVHGESTKRALAHVLGELGIDGPDGLGEREPWFAFLRKTRERAFARAAHDVLAASRPETVLSDSVASALMRVANYMPSIEELRDPIADALERVMLAQGASRKDLTKAPNAAPWNLNRGQWLAKLKGAERHYNAHAKLGIYYRRYATDEPFAEKTLGMAIDLAPDLIAFNVVKANSSNAPAATTSSDA